MSASEAIISFAAAAATVAANSRRSSYPADQSPTSAEPMTTDPWSPASTYQPAARPRQPDV